MKWGKGALVVVGALIITALGIDAADTFRGNEGTLLSQVIQTDKNSCPNGMSPIDTIDGISCADTFEATVGEDCPISNPGSVINSNQNIEESSCEPVSKEGATPWRFVTRDQAMQMCARAGKRLPTAKEWYGLSLGLSNPEENCNVASGAMKHTGNEESCVTPAGLYDMVGNVWEWVSDDVIDGMYESRQLPDSGYVFQVDAGGMAVLSTSTEQDLFGKDYFWAKDSGAYGIIRGGYYSSKEDAGIYSVHADTPPNTAGVAIGFRCVK